MRQNAFKDALTMSTISFLLLYSFMLYNACFTYQEDKSYNLLISALDELDMGSLVDDNMFMNTFSELS
jgi:hypothetical protein